MNEPKSRLIARFDTTANAENRRPAITGSFAVAGDGVVHSFRAWSGVSEGGKAYLRGTHEPEKLTKALKARHAVVVEVDDPPGIELKPGELVLFENTSVADNVKRPTWYGYARISEGYVRLSAWDRAGNKGAKLLAGTAEPYRPADKVGVHPPKDEPSL